MQSGHVWYNHLYPSPKDRRHVGAPPLNSICGEVRGSGPGKTVSQSENLNPHGFPRSLTSTMIRKFPATVLSLALLLSISAFAQANGAAPTTTAPAATPAAAGSLKFAVIDIQTAIIATNEGQRDFNALNTKFDPKRNELQAANKE